MMLFKGRVIKGKGRGKEMGFPTINLAADKDVPTGVYICKATLNGRSYWGLLHSGPRPVFKEKDPSVEVFLFEFGGLVPREITVWVEKRLRDVMDFASPKKLVEQIEKDRKEALKYIANKP